MEIRPFFSRAILLFIFLLFFFLLNEEAIISYFPARRISIISFLKEMLPVVAMLILIISSVFLALLLKKYAPQKYGPHIQHINLPVCSTNPRKCLNPTRLITSLCFTIPCFWRQPLFFHPSLNKNVFNCSLI